MPKCDEDVFLMGTGVARASAMPSQAAAISAANANVPAWAASEAREKAHEELTCPAECPHVYTGSVKYYIVRTTASRWGLFEVLASLFTFSWKWEGKAEFIWWGWGSCVKVAHPHVDLAEEAKESELPTSAPISPHD